MLIESLKNLDAEVREVVLRSLRFKIPFKKNRFYLCTIHVVFQLVYPAILLYTVCIFRWIYQAWASTVTGSPTPVLLRGCPAARAGPGSACHGEGTFVGTDG